MTPQLPAMTPQAFIAKWRNVEFGEKQASQEMFLDLCALVGHPTPVAYGNPDAFTFEKWVPGGFADAYLEDRFGWEFKGSDDQLPGAFNQLLRYQVYLKTPPLLIVSSFRRIQIRTNFPGMETVLHEIPILELEEPGQLAKLRNCFFAPDEFRPNRSVEDVTRETAELFRDIVADMEQHIHDNVTPYSSDNVAPYSDTGPERLARYLNRIVFCLYAEDAGLLPDSILADILNANRRRPDLSNRAIANLFEQMAGGGLFGPHEIAHFNGDLFRGDPFRPDDPVELSPNAMQRLGEAVSKNWRNIEPSIFGTLFERALDASQRARLGAHYTGADDIMLVINPVVMDPLEREWDAARGEIEELSEAGFSGLYGLSGLGPFDGGETPNPVHPFNPVNPASDDSPARQRLEAFRERLASVTVLDPACGSGNFLYLALRSLLDLEKRVIDYAAMQGWHGLTPMVKPNQMRGLEINPYAAELARTALWIGYIQWHQANGFPYTQNPILTPLDTIRQTDAILDLTDPEHPAEPEWPAAEFIIGNPPFLGRGIRNALGDEYTSKLYGVYGNRLPNASDLCCYWFEKARAMIERRATKRAGLLATQGIRGRDNRAVLRSIKESGDVFMAYPDKEWILDGATVHISIVGFDDGSETQRFFDGQMISGAINSDLTVGVDTTTAQRLAENRGIAFEGPSPKGPFDIDPELAARMLSEPLNVNGQPNSDVVRPLLTARDITQGDRGMYTIDFGTMGMDDACQYEMPFEHVAATVKPVRANNRIRKRAEYWWLYGSEASQMRMALQGLNRYIATPRHSKHRLFVWVQAGIMCNDSTNVFARDDDYTFGILHSRLHELWTRNKGTQVREAESGFRYTPTTCFETFPFPEPTGEQREAIALAAAELNRLRENDTRTLTNLYNARPTWLDNAHRALDAAVADAYGWPADLADAEILERLLALNLERAGA